ncbi:undecaprenyl-diphosphate phosphatase [Hominenteromicrobium sp.]|uniref:undecaprenyl-diphosphate phosphatase n=1 Tax=Hominenteromicrobium sp. TaxID=3073581 RepID=UPI003999FBA8
MSIFEAIIQGIVQGATEFLPVSSSGHLSLAQHIMGVKVDSLLFDILFAPRHAHRRMCRLL